MININNIKSTAVNFVKNNYLWIIIAVLILAMIISTKEGFEDYDGHKLAEYPGIFLEKITSSFGDNKLIDYYLPSENKFEPYSVETQHMILEASETKIPVDIGNGVVVETVVKIPTQETTVQSQNTVEMPKPVKTKVIVEEQIVTIPSQTGLIPAKVPGGGFVAVPVSVPEQQVVIEKQNSILPVIEAFKSTRSLY
jgi:hypothetical protein